MTDIRICFIGDSLTNGTGDPAFLGWPGRVAQREVRAGHRVTVYDLGVRAETTEMIRRRWRAECEPRLPDMFNGALTISFGTNDSAEEAGKTRVAFDRTLENARAIAAETIAWKPTLWIGPPPIDESQQPFRAAPTSPERFYSNDRLARMSDAFGRIAREEGVPYLDLFTPLAGDPAWTEGFRQGDGVHPAETGYALMAERIAGWDAWRALFRES